MVKNFWTPYTIPGLDRLLVERDENAVALYSTYDDDFGKLEFLLEAMLAEAHFEDGLVHRASSMRWWLER